MHTLSTSGRPATLGLRQARVQCEVFKVFIWGLETVTSLWSAAPILLLTYSRPGVSDSVRPSPDCSTPVLPASSLLLDGCDVHTFLRHRN